jgi:hypothetical protein
MDRSRFRQESGRNGDKITVQFIPARHGSPLGYLKSVAMPDGGALNFSAGGAND